MAVVVGVAGRMAFRISARGQASARTELYLKSWTKSPSKSLRLPAMKMGGRLGQLEQRPSELGEWQTGQRF